MKKTNNYIKFVINVLHNINVLLIFIQVLLKLFIM